MWKLADRAYRMTVKRFAQYPVVINRSFFLDLIQERLHDLFVFFGAEAEQE